MVTVMNDESGISARALVARLGSLNRRTSRDADRRLARLGSAAIEPLLHRLNEESGRRKHNSKKSFAATLLGIGFYIWLAPRLHNPANWIMLAAFIPITLLIMHWNAWSRLQINAARLLTKIDDVRAIGPLADALESRDMWVVSSTRTIASEALVRLLPRVTANDGDLLNTRQRECLYRALDHAGMYDPELTRAVINVLRLIGDADAEKPLRRLIGNRYFVGRHSGLQNEAVTALDTIHARVLRTRNTDDLLRAADAGCSPDLLMRAVEPEAIEVDPGELLRAEGALSSAKHIRKKSDASAAAAHAKRLANGSGDIRKRGADAEIDPAIQIRTVRK